MLNPKHHLFTPRDTRFAGAKASLQYTTKQHYEDRAKRGNTNMQRSSSMKECDVSHQSVTTTTLPTRSFLSSSYTSRLWVLNYFFFKENLSYLLEISQFWLPFVMI